MNTDNELNKLTSITLENNGKRGCLVSSRTGKSGTCSGTCWLAGLFAPEPPVCPAPNTLCLKSCKPVSVSIPFTASFIAASIKTMSIGNRRSHKMFQRIRNQKRKDKLIFLPLLSSALPNETLKNHCWLSFPIQLKALKSFVLKMLPIYCFPSQSLTTDTWSEQIA